MRFIPSSGVLYAEDFDAPEPAAVTVEVAAPSPEPVVIEPTFSLADLHRATKRAEQEARAQERQDAATTSEARAADALVRIAEALKINRSESADVAKAAASATADTILAMVAAVLPAFSADRGAQEVTALLQLLLPSMTHQPRLAIRLHPSLIDAVRDALAAALEDGQTMIDWLGSTTMQPGDLSVRWQDGIMFRDTNALCTQVCALVMPGLDPIVPKQETNDVK